MNEPREPLIEAAIAPETRSDQRKLETALAALSVDGVKFSVDPESGQTILKAMSVAQIDRTVTQLRGEFSIEADVGAPQVAYRERLKRAVEINHTHKQQRGGAGEFARVRIHFAPRGEGEGYRFENTAGASVPGEFISAIEKGLDASRENGVLTGFPLIDFAATLVDGAYHEMDSTPLAFEIAARAAFRELKNRKAVVLLEPIMKVEVSTPDDNLGGVIGDLNSRRGLIQGAGDGTRIVALVPLANLFDYEAKLKAMTQGKAEATIKFSHYDEAPRPWNDDPSPFPPAMGMRA